MIYQLSRVPCKHNILIKIKAGSQEETNVHINVHFEVITPKTP